MPRTKGVRPVEAMNIMDIRVRKLEEKIKQHEESLVVHSTRHRKTAIVQAVASVLLSVAILLSILL
jgi:pyruvate kinase